MVWQSKSGKIAGSLFRFRTTIRGKLCLLFLAVLVPTLAIKSIEYYNQFRSREAMEVEADQKLALAEAQTFESFVQDIVHQELAIGVELSFSKPLTTQQMNWILERNKKDYPELRCLSWVGPRGLIRASSTQSAIGMNISDRAYLQGTFAGKEWTLSNLLLSRSTGRPIFVISRGIRDEQRHLIGIVVAGIFPQKLGTLLRGDSNQGETITLFDRKARAVFRNPVIPWSWRQRSTLMHNPMLHKALQGKEVTATVTGFFDDKESLTALVPVPSSGWVVSASQPVREALQPIFSQTLWAGGFFTLLLIAVFAAAMIFSAYIIGPLKKLHDHALDIGRGNMGKGIAIQGSREVQDLASAFNTMTEEIRKREEALESARLRLFSLLEAMPAFVYLLAADFSIRYANRTFRETFGDPEGKTCFALTRGQKEPCSDCTSSSVLEQQTFHDREWTSPAGRSYRIFDRAFSDLDGSMLVLKVGIDVTDQKKAEKALKHSEARYRAVVENQTELVSRFLPDGTLTFVNQAYCRYFGEDPEQILGKRFWHHIPPGDQEKFRAHLAAMGSEQPIAVIEHEVHSASGERRWQQWTDRAIYNDTGQVVEFQAVGRDITERKRAEEALRESERDLRLLSTRLLSAQEEERKRIAVELHDSIGASLSAIKIRQRRLLGTMHADSEPARSIETLIAVTQQTIDEIRRIMTALRPSMLDDLGLITTIDSFCESFQAMYADIFIEQDIGVEERDIPEDLKIVIYRVMQEAFHNIAKYSKTEFVELSLKKTAAVLELTIKDYGQGFDFEPIFSRDNYRKGLGLTSMRERTELSGGSFQIESNKEEGTTIRASWKLLG